MKHRHVILDIESDGPLLGVNSMVCFGAVILTPELDITFYGQTAPISKQYEPEALAISGFSRKEHEKFQDPAKTMQEFFEWLQEHTSKLVLWSDNNGYDASWINWYFLTYCGSNPFSWSSRRIGDLFCGFYNDLYYSWKKHRAYKFGFKHTHCPLEDSKANAAAMLYLHDQGLKIKLE